MYQLNMLGMSNSRLVDETFAIWSADRKMWFNRKAKTPAEEFQLKRSESCEFSTRAEAEACLGMFVGELEEVDSEYENFIIIGSRSIAWLR